jgi:hypothetical protein
MRLFTRKTSANLAEVHQYVQDLKGITALREKAVSEGRGAVDPNSKADTEVQRYDEIIQVMQLVMLELNKVT